MPKPIETLLAAAILLFAGVSAQAQSGASAQGEQQAGSSGVVRLAQPQSTVQGKAATGPKDTRRRQPGQDQDAQDRRGRFDDGSQSWPPEAPLSEFEQFVNRLAATAKTPRTVEGEILNPIRRFGSELGNARADADTDGGASMAPDDYVLGAGDEVLLNIWGSVEGNLRLKVDRTGALAIPRIGSVPVSGVRFSELRPLIVRSVGRQFRQFDVSVALGDVKAVRVFVTGYVQRPGSYSVGGLTSLLQAVMQAGGPNAVGSFRNIQLRRGKDVVTQLDLYKLLLEGDRSADRALRSGDVIHVGAVGTQVAVIGSVNNPAVFELKSGDNLGEVLRMAGGLSAVANRGAAALYSFDDKQGQALSHLDLDRERNRGLRNGDVLVVGSAADLARPAADVSKRVRVDGEVRRPGDYVLPAGSTLRDAIAAAGGLTSSAFLYGTEFTRESVRASQQENYDRVLRELETEFNRAAVSRKELVVPPTEDQVRIKNGQLRLIENLRSFKPTGRVVLQMTPESRDLPPIALDDRDRLYVPSRPTVVNVYGSVFNGGSYEFTEGRRLRQYLDLAGGALRSADTDSTFVVRANGSVVSGRNMHGGWIFADSDLLARVGALPGDTVFVPENLARVSWTQEAKDWAQILSQFGLGAVALKNLK